MEVKMDKNNNIINKYRNISELVEDNPEIKNTTNIYRCCNGKRKTTHGYKWSFGGGLLQ